MDLTDIGKTGGVGLIGALLGYLGFRGKVNAIEKRVDSLANSVRYADTCKAMHEALNTRLDGIESGMGTIQGDIKKILGRLPK